MEENDAAPGTAFVGARQLRDRRKLFQWSNPQHIGLAQGRRAGERRTGDRMSCYVDTYPAALLPLAVATLLLSCLDAVLTLILIENGAVEMNFLLADLVANDVQKFLHVKFSLTALCVILLVIHHRFPVYGRYRVHHAANAVCGLYVAVVLYEIVLLYVMHLRHVI